MKMSILILFFGFVINSYSQLNCRNEILPDSTKQTKCFHQNGKISTIESWDSEKKFGKLTGYNQNGRELFYFSLRKVGGSALAQISYYPNGQVSKIDFSDSPDGGIQFYSAFIKFDTEGNQTDAGETNYPPELLTAPPSVPQPLKQETMECATLVQDIFEVKNNTKSKISFHVKSIPNFNYASKEFYFTLKPNQSLVFDSIISAQQHLSKPIYEPDIVSYTKKRKNKVLNFVLTQTDENNKRQWIWTVNTQ